MRSYMFQVRHNKDRSIHDTHMWLLSMKPMQTRSLVLALPGCASNTQTCRVLLHRVAALRKRSTRAQHACCGSRASLKTHFQTLEPETQGPTATSTSTRLFLQQHHLQHGPSCTLTQEFVRDVCRGFTARTTFSWDKLVEAPTWYSPRQLPSSHELCNTSWSNFSHFLKQVPIFWRHTAAYDSHFLFSGAAANQANYRKVNKTWILGNKKVNLVTSLSVSGKQMFLSQLGTEKHWKFFDTPETKSLKVSTI